MTTREEMQIEALTWALCADAGGSGRGKCDPEYCTCGGTARGVYEHLVNAGMQIAALSPPEPTEKHVEPFIEQLRGDARWLRENLPARFPAIDLADVANDLEEAARLLASRAMPLQDHGWQREVLDWAVDKFGKVALDRRERAMRFVEEALELGQAECLSHREVQALAERVFSRAQGFTLKEIAQAGLTLEVLAENIGVKIAPLIQQEISRIKSIPKEEWQRRHAAKVAIGITGGPAILAEDQTSEAKS